MNGCFRGAIDQLACHLQRMSCGLSELPEKSRPPDSELADLIEQAFLDELIDGQKANLVYLWLTARRENYIG
jgi:hypothetical protein